MKSLLLLVSCATTLAQVGMRPEPRGIPTSLPPRETARATDPYARRSDVSRPGPRSDANRHYPLDARQSNQQIPIAVCPEQIGLPAKSCDSCGGDSNTPGICNNLLLSGAQSLGCWSDPSQCVGYYCDCTNGGGSGNQRVTSVTVVNGQAGTVIYEEQTLTAYAKLRASTTVTLTEEATATTGNSLETQALVIFAGGLAWLAIAESGNAAAIAALSAPKNPPDDAQQDDDKCKPEPNCHDCGGADAQKLCTSGTQAGCPCEEKQNCPNEPPKCSDSQCGGDNGSSQCAGGGETKGCTCCPDTPPTCDDSSCHGNLKQLCTTDKLSQCGCLMELDGAWSGGGDVMGSSIGDQGSRAQAVLSAAQDIFKSFYDSDKTKVPGYEAGSGSGGPGGGGPGSAYTGMMVALASYINPLADPSLWNKMIAYDSHKVPVLCANVVNGPNSVVDKDWTNVINRAIGSGKTMLGYVRTGYLGVSDGKYTTRLGSTALGDWIAQIEMDVDLWYSLYGTDLGGIFFDEGMNTCGPTDGDNTYADAYTWINRYVKTKYSNAYTVLNPGSTQPECYSTTMDTLLTFEGSYEDYVNNYVANPWHNDDPRKIWHIVHDMPSTDLDAVSKAATLAKNRNVGLIQLTDGIEPNPYNTLPSDLFMSTQIGDVGGGSLPVGKAAEFPPGGSPGAPLLTQGSLSATPDYSSVRLSWGSMAGATGYNIMSGGKTVASVPAGINNIQIGNIKPGTTTSYTISAVGNGGKLSSASNSVSLKTQALPNGGKTIINYSASVSGGSTTVKADVLVPYAFVRVYFWEGAKCNSTAPGWPINWDKSHYACAKYMVEGTTLFQYTGTITDSTTNYPWSWKSLGTVGLTQSGYTYTWTIPLGSSTIDTSWFIVQAQGYNPLTNVFQPDPTVYDCKGSSYCGQSLIMDPKWCDSSVEELVDGTSYTSGTSSNGQCWGYSSGGACGTFVQNFGGTCSMTGAEMKHQYWMLREIAGCQTCGSYHGADGCLFTVNYVSHC